MISHQYLIKNRTLEKIIYLTVSSSEKIKIRKIRRDLYQKNSNHLKYLNEINDNFK